MTLSIDTPTYNEKRHGKPFIAAMTFEEPKGEPRWGDWVGSPGEPGLLVLEDVNGGDVVMRGQKDQHTEYTAPSFFILLEDGELRDVSKKEAYLHYKGRKAHRADRLAGGWKD